MRYQVETYTLCDGWINCWSDGDENPITYATKEEAEAGLKEFFEDQKEAVRCGDMFEEYSPDDYRVAYVREK